MRRHARLVSWLLIRHWRHHPVRQALTVFSLALGVALYLATDLTLGAIGAAVSTTQEALAGDADLTVSRGSSGLLPDEVKRLRQRPEFAAVAPTVQASAVLLREGKRERTLTVVGLDPAQVGRVLRGATPAVKGQQLDFVRLALDPRAIVLTELGGERLHAGLGAELVLTTARGEGRFVVAGLVAVPHAAREVLAGYAFLPLASAQRHFGRGSRVDRVDLVLAQDVTKETGRSAARASVSDSAVVTSHAERGEDQLSAIAGFRAMLVLESLLVFVVALFFIYNTISAAVADRAKDAGLLRCIGLDRRGLRGLFLLEAGCSGAIGLGLGLVLGFFLARLGLAFMVQSVGTLYFQVPDVESLQVRGSEVLVAAALAIGTALFAALLACRPLTRGPVLEFLRPVTSAALQVKGMRRTAGIGLLLLGVAIVLPFVMPPRGPFPLGRVVSLLLPASIGLVAPYAFVLGAGALRRRLARRAPLPVLLALDATRAHPARTAMTITAFALSLGLVIGHGAVGRSMTDTLRAWLMTAIPGDLILGTGVASPVPSTPIEKELFAPLRTLPGVTDLVHMRLVRLATAEHAFMCLALDLEAASRHSSRTFVAGDPALALPRCAKGEAVLVSENLALKLGLHVGDPLVLPASDGAQAVPIAGILRDYNSPIGTVYLDYAAYTRLFHDELVDFLEVCVDAETKRDLPAFQARLLQALPEQYRGFLNVLTRESFVSGAIRAVEDINSLSSVQIGLSSLIGSVGIMVTVTLSVLSRRRELALLRAVGMDRATLRRTVVLEVFGLAAASIAVGLVIGNLVFLPANLVFREFAGFAFDYRFPLVPCAWATLVAAVTALVSTVIPLRSVQSLDLLSELE